MQVGNTQEPHSTAVLSRCARTLSRGLLAISVLLLAAGCGSSAPEAPPQNLTFSLGTNADLVGGLLEHYRSALPHLRITPETSYGAYVVARDLEEGRGDIGIAQADAVYLSYRRGSANRPQPHTELRGMAVLGVNATYVLTRMDSDIRRVGDLAGRRIGLLEPGTSSEGVARIVLETAGLSHSKIQTVSIRVPSGVQELSAGTLDAIIIAVPMERINDELLKAQVKAVSLDPALIERLETEYPFLRAIEVPVNRLWGQKEPLQSVGADALLICRRELSDDIVYDMTRELFVALPALAKKFEAAEAMDPSLAATTPIPLHPGAARYYRERELLK